MNNSSVIGKILIVGDLVLKSPLLIGDGAGETVDNFRDVHVLKIGRANRSFMALRYVASFAIGLKVFCPRGQRNSLVTRTKCKVRSKLRT